MRAFVLIGALALAGALGGCAHPGVVQQCLPLKAYTAEEQTALGAAVAALPGSSPMIAAMADYARMRAADRACMGVGK